MKAASQRFSTRASFKTYLTYFIKMGLMPTEDPAQVPTNDICADRVNV